ncbi:hypothetical protein PFISCL1PPCAC_3670, partial [Pristionchus fissidentatus]
LDSLKSVNRKMYSLATLEQFEKVRDKVDEVSVFESKFGHAFCVRDRHQSKCAGYRIDFAIGYHKESSGRRRTASKDQLEAWCRLKDARPGGTRSVPAQIFDNLEKLFKKCACRRIRFANRWFGTREFIPILCR